MNYVQNEINNAICPVCKNKNMLLATLSDAYLREYNKAFAFKCSRIINIICSECGCIVRQFAEHPNNLK